MGGNFQNVEMDGFAEGSALSDEDDVTFLDGESRGQVSGDVAVSLFVTVVFGHIVEIVASDHNGALHLGGNDNALENLSSDGDVAGEGALLVDVVGLNGFLGGLEVEANILVVAHTGAGLLGEQLLAVQEDVVLLLEGAFVLN